MAAIKGSPSGSRTTANSTVAKPSAARTVSMVRCQRPGSITQS